MQKLIINTQKNKEVIDLTRIVNDLLMKNSFYSGTCVLFVSHSSCAITTGNLDPGTDEDYLSAINFMFPKFTYKHYHNPSHVGDHIMSSIIGQSIVIPVSSSSLVLGKDHKLMLIELNGPNERHINIIFIPEKEYGRL